jgi:hypothetical protein
MAPTLEHVILTEGANLHRDIRAQGTRWKEAMEEPEAASVAPEGQALSRRSKRLSSPLHAYYPFLFHSCFQAVAIETVRELARADRLYTEHLLSHDRMLDGPRSTEPVGLFLAQLQHMHSLKTLHSLFPSAHCFWDYFNECFFETWKSFREERLWHSHRIGRFPMARFCTLAKGKTAVLRPFSLALAFLAGTEEQVHLLARSLDQHHIALTLIDDLEDWREDLQTFNFTYLLTRLIQREGLTEQISSGHAVSTERMGQLLHATGLVEKQLRLAEIFFRKSNETVRNLPLPLWKSFNDGFHARYRALRYDMTEIRRREEGRVRMRRSLQRRRGHSGNGFPENPSVRAIQSGIRFLARCLKEKSGFALWASPHTYMHPSKPIATSRAVITLAVRSLRTVQSLDASAAPLLQAASNELRRIQRTTPHPGLPAALEGAFECMPSQPEQLSQKDRTFAPGYGPLPDGLLWANYLYICSQIGYRPPRLAAYVVDCVRRTCYGSWSFGVAFGPVASPWTRYACRPLLPLLLICQALGNELPRKALQDDLLEPYRTKRHWHNTTEIALILLCLLCTTYDGPELPSAIIKLTESQERDGSWAPNAVYREDNTCYGSREMTTAWCVEALARHHSRGRGAL